MVQNYQGPREIRLVSSEAIPQQLFVCSARIKPEAGQLLKSFFKSGTSIPKELEVLYNAHLTYTDGWGDKYYQGGPSTDFTEILYIFATDSQEEAQKIMQEDPFYQEGVLFDDSWFPWEVHSPYWRIPPYFIETDKKFQSGAGLRPEYPPGMEPAIEEIRVAATTPYKLFACFSKMNRDVLKPYLSPESKTASMILIQHVYNCSGQGGAGPMGYHWLAGPSIDYTQDLTILSVNSLMMAQLIKENDAFSRYGLFYDIRYFEWCIHIPLRKASPQHRGALIQLFKNAGINVHI
jgi:uncharacterized protein YciI